MYIKYDAAPTWDKENQQGYSERLVMCGYDHTLEHTRLMWDTYALSFTHTKTQVQSYMMIHTRTWAYHLRTRWVPKYFFWSFVSKKYPPSDELEWKHLPLLRIRFRISNRSKNLQGRSSLSNQSSKRTASGRGSLQSLTTMTHQTWKIGALFRSACARAREGETVRAKARARERG